MLALWATHMVSVMSEGSMLASHREAARLAEFLVLCDHTLGDFRHVRDEIGTDPHRIGRASVADLGTALSSGVAQANKK
jgi:hypothetical protein